MSFISIAIDGPAGAGKSTAAKNISKKLGIAYLDTGSMYRAVALKAITESIDTKNQTEMEDLVRDIDIEVDYRYGRQRILLDGSDISEQIRTPEISIGASNVAVIPAVRLKLVKLQRDFASRSDVVMDGRDIGTFVLPDAQYKFFITASLEERAKRRYLELHSQGKKVKMDEVIQDIIFRDKNDSTRAFAPLIKAPDALEIDTSALSPQEVMTRMLSFIDYQQTFSGKI